MRFMSIERKASLIALWRAIMQHEKLEVPFSAVRGGHKTSYPLIYARNCYFYASKLTLRVNCTTEIGCKYKNNLAVL